MGLNPQIASSLITGGASFLGGLFGIGSQAAANEANMELAKYNWEQQKEMWHMNNEYNKPSAQMARYLEAGLNPNLIYGSGSASAGNSTSTPTPQMPHVEPLTDGSFFGSAAAQAVNTYNNQRIVESDVKQKESIANYNNEAAKAKKEEATLTALKQIGERYKNDSNEFERPYLKRIYEAKVRSLEEQLRGLEQHNEWFDVTYNDRITQLKQAGINLFRQGENIDASTKLFVERSFEAGENVLYLQSKCEQLKYELDTNPDPEIAKAYNTKMLELKQSIEEANEFVSQVSKYGKALEPYANMLTNAVEAASGFYNKAKGINRQAKMATK